MPDSAAPSSSSDTKLPSSKPSWFPLGYRDTFSQWWASISPAAAEHKVLSFIPYLQQAPTHYQTGIVAPQTEHGHEASAHDDTSHSASLAKTTSHEEDPHGPRRWHSSLVKLSGNNRALNEFSVERVGEDVENNLVMLHGYGAGLGLFYKNFEPLSQRKNWRLYALDLLGMGRSSRPPFRIHAKDRQGKINEAENWFIDALEEWRKERKIDKMTLLGHSMGGYMAVAYALKYPGHLNKIILASPVGVPEDPYATQAAMPEPDESTLPSELTQDQSSTTRDQNNFMNAQSKASDKDGEPKRRPLPKWFAYLWDANMSPFSLVRWSGPLGPRLVSGWTSRRFNQMPEAEASALHDYAYSLFRQRGSGEFVLAYVLAPGAFARSPLIRRIDGVGRQSFVNANGTTVNEGGIPVVLMYGENDWMDVAGGYAAEEKLKVTQRKAIQAAPETADKDHGDPKVLIVRNAGHHLYLDGWKQFNSMILGEMEDVEKRQRQLKQP